MASSAVAFACSASRLRKLAGQHPYLPGGHPRRTVHRPDGEIVGGPWQTQREYLEIYPKRILYTSHPDAAQRRVRGMGAAGWRGGSDHVRTDRRAGLAGAIEKKFLYSDTTDSTVYGWWNFVSSDRSTAAEHCEDYYAGTFPAACLRAPRTVVAETVTAAGGTEHEHTRARFFYANGREHQQGRGFLGFAVVWETNQPGTAPRTYRYSGFGELLEARGPASASDVDLEYDALGRVLKRTSAGVVSQYRWDTAANGVGRLHWSERDGIRKTHSYDASGLLQQTSYALGDAAPFVEEVKERDAYDRPKRIKLPDGPQGGSLQLDYTYDDRTGAVAQIDRITAAGTRLVWKLNKSTIAGAIEEEQFGNQVVTTWGVNALTNRIESLRTGASGALQNYSFHYDAAGNLDQRFDHNRLEDGQPFREELGHDAMNRLEVQEMFQAGRSINKVKFGYDALGNVRSREETSGTFRELREFKREHASNPYALTSIPGVLAPEQIAYDTSGRLQRKGTLEVEYTSSDQPARIFTTDASLPETRYAYDADGQLARAVRGGVTTYFAGSLEKEVGASATPVFRYHVSNGIRAVATLIWSTAGQEHRRRGRCREGRNRGGAAGDVAR